MKYKKFGHDIFLLYNKICQDQTLEFRSKTPSLGCRVLVSDANGKVLGEILSFDTDLVVLNDKSPTYFRYKSDYSESLDLFICPSKTANSVLNYEVMADRMMGSDHAPITLGLKFIFRIQSKPSEPKFNFNKAD